MVRQQQSSNNKNQNQPNQAATGLLNFHFSTPPVQASTPSLSSSSRGGNYNSNRRNNNNNNNNNNNRGGGGRGRGRGNNNNRNNNNNKQRYNQNRSAQDRASARRNANASMFYLHSSADHAFILTRRGPGNAMVHQQQKQGYSFAGCDEPVAWESVRIVKQLVPTTTTTTSTPTATSIMTLECPICLDAFICPRITKCGHTFCLKCILRHLQTSTLSNPYQAVKCPCCALPVIVNEMRPVIVESYRPPILHKRMKLIKLHRMKDCPAPYLPIPNQLKHSNPHTAPCMTDLDAKYCRFNYIDPLYYQDHLLSNQKELQQEVELIRRNLSPSSSNSSSSSSSSVEISFLTMALQIVQKEQQRAQDEMEEEQTLMERFASFSTGMYQPQSPNLIAAKRSNIVEEEGRDLISAVLVEEKGGEEDSKDLATTTHSHHPLSPSGTRDEGQNGNEFTVPTSPTSSSSMIAGRYRGDSIGSYHSIESSSSDPQHGSSPLSKSPNNRKQRRSNNRRCIPLPASMYLEDNAVHLYQAEDGQLVFLNGFNVACLVSDSSKNVPIEDNDATFMNTNTPNDTHTADYTSYSTPHESSLLEEQLTTTGTNKLEENSFPIPTMALPHPPPPLPDFVEGTVLEMETVQITHDIRKRMPFLAHIPLCTDVIFVELDLNDRLSNATKLRFKAELAKRRKRRQSKVQAEKRVDREIQKREEEKIQQRKARLQRIDPNDDFFHVIPATEPSPPEPTVLIGEEFGPSLSANHQPQCTNHQSPSPRVPQQQHHDAPPVAVASSTTVSFSAACRRAGGDPISAPDAFPALGGSSSIEAFPALGGGCATEKKKATATWGGNTSSSLRNHPQTADPSVSNTTSTLQTTFPPVGKKKRGGKKLVLFSTGGQRGS